jgi:hypothetical protein
MQLGERDDVTKNRVRWIWLFLSFAAIFAVVLLLQSRAASFQDFAHPVHMSVDWSNRHVIYSGPPTGPNAWRAMQDPRYRRHLSIFGNRKSIGEEREEREDPDKWRDRRGHGPIWRQEESPLKRDWQFNLGENSVTTNALNYFIYPAKFSFDINATPSCTNDFVTFPTGLPGATGGQASIVALNELYSGSGAGGTGICGTGQPSVMWAYNTNLAGDDSGQIFSSPVLSLDGSKVAFVETNTSSGGAVLKILKWVAGEGTVSAAVAPATITTGNAWSTCPTTGTSCLFSLPFSGGNSDSISSPFYNYSNDTIYAGDDNGVLHKFTGVFNGTPAEVTSGGWPMTISPGNTLTGPVFDAVSGNIFVADTVATLFYVRETGSTAGACVSGTPPCMGTPSLAVSSNNFFSQGVFDPPTLDQTSQMVFVFTGYDPNNNAAVIQATTALANPVDTVLQGGYNPIFSGAFDQNYNSGNYASGFLYACGTNPLGLYRVGFNSSGVMNSALEAGSVNIELGGDSGPLCTPITEILNGANDYLFFGVDALGSPTGCDNGCVLGLNLTGMAWPPSLSAFSVLTVPNGPSGIIVDNVGTGGQESSIYFGPQANNCTSPSGSGCAVKATQSGLN